MPPEFTDLFALPSLRTSEIVANLGVSLLCGLAIALLYRWTYRGTSYSATFASALVTLAMITAVVMMVIGNNLARAFGLVGAMSIIRFRTPVKDAQDIAFIFLSLAAGLAAGVGFHRLAVLGVLLIGLTILLLAGTNFAARARRHYLLEFFSSEDDAAAAYLPLLEHYCRSHRLLNVKALGENRLMLSFYVRLKHPDQSRAFVQALGQATGVENVNLFFDVEDA